MAAATRTYRVLLEWDAEGAAWCVSVPALPGCFTFGDTREEALRQAEEAIECHLLGLRADGEPLPEDDDGEIVLERVSVSLPAERR